jgi:hypothetical protein
MPTLNYPQTSKWIVAHNNIDVFHVSEVHPNNCFATGQPYMDVFDTKDELLSAFPQLTSHFFPIYTDFITETPEEIPEEILEEELEGYLTIF